MLSKPICHIYFESMNDRTNRTRGIRKRRLRLCRGEKFFAPTHPTIKKTTQETLTPLWLSVLSPCPLWLIKRVR